MTVFRSLTTGDEPAVARLWHDAWHDGHATALPPEIIAQRTLETFVRRLQPLREGAVVAADNGRIVGFSVVLDAEIDQFYVAADRRGSGLADRLMAATETELRRRGVREAQLQCSVGNDRARCFYLRAGWREDGIRDLPLWTPDGRTVTHPTHVFVKRLSNQD